MSAPRLLIVDDEATYRDTLAAAFRREGFEVEVSADGNHAIEVFDTFHPDVILLDVMLPGRSGVDVCRELRTRSDVPIIMVSARAAEIDAVVGLEVGADDYVAKPFRLRELIARVRAALRRAPKHTIPDDAPATLSIGDIELDIARHEVRVRGELVGLARKEFQLLQILMEKAGRVLPRDVLLKEVWGADFFGDSKTLDVHIKRVRSKVEVDPNHPTCIVTVRGVGYRYEP
ncbi:MAG: response regulator transcription factor [Acidimicrobiia bacterium]